MPAPLAFLKLGMGLLKKQEADHTAQQEVVKQKTRSIDALRSHVEGKSHLDGDRTLRLSKDGPAPLDVSKSLAKKLKEQKEESDVKAENSTEKDSSDYSTSKQTNKMFKDQNNQRLVRLGTDQNIIDPSITDDPRSSYSSQSSSGETSLSNDASPSYSSQSSSGETSALFDNPALDSLTLSSTDSDETDVEVIDESSTADPDSRRIQKAYKNSGEKRQSLDQVQKKEKKSTSAGPVSTVTSSLLSTNSIKSTTANQAQQKTKTSATYDPYKKGASGNNIIRQIDSAKSSLKLYYEENFDQTSFTDSFKPNDAPSPFEASVSFGNDGEVSFGNDAPPPLETSVLLGNPSADINIKFKSKNVEKGDLEQENEEQEILTKKSFAAESVSDNHNSSYQVQIIPMKDKLEKEAFVSLYADVVAGEDIQKRRIAKEFAENVYKQAKKGNDDINEIMQDIAANKDLLKNNFNINLNYYAGINSVEQSKGETSLPQATTAY